MSIWRKRIGGISPTVIEVITYDFYRMAPPDVGFVGISSNIDFWNNENFDDAFASLTKAANYLGERDVDFIIHFGTPLAVSRGPGYGPQITRMIEDETGVPATTSISSAASALRLVGAEKIAIASPYPVEINDNLERYLSAEGFSVESCRTMDVRFRGLQDVEPSVIEGFGLDVLANAPDADALYIPCPQWPAADAVTNIERKSGKTVVASDPADYFAAFRSLGLGHSVDGFGKLLQSLSVC